MSNDLSLEDEEPTLDIADDDLVLDDEEPTLGLDMSDEDGGSTEDYIDNDIYDDGYDDAFDGGGEGSSIGAFTALLIVSFIMYASAMALVLFELSNYCEPGAFPWS